MLLMEVVGGWVYQRQGQHGSAVIDVKGPVGWWRKGRGKSQRFR